MHLRFIIHFAAILYSFNSYAVAVIPGAGNMAAYLPQLGGKRVGLIVNQTSVLGNIHLVDTLIKRGVKVVKIFAPEHGFRGKADAGEKISDSVDPSTGIPIISIYGSKRAPQKSDLEGVDILVFDIQDVGVRFYTYISTLHYVMQSCHENNRSLIVLDRPNPNGHFVDGNILDTAYRSFVGMHPVPIVHGMTIGEYGQMINGENWLGFGRRCQLEVIPCLGYRHADPYDLPIPPSPNLPNMRAILLYPSICYFEGTPVSLGRGTDKQFQVLGAPAMQTGDFTFTPRPFPGATNPPQNGLLCRGRNLSGLEVEDLRRLGRIDLSYLISFYRDYPQKDSFFLKGLFFDKLAGGSNLREMLVAGYSEERIRESWQPGLAKFLLTRKKYLLYQD